MINCTKIVILLLLSTLILLFFFNNNKVIQVILFLITSLFCGIYCFISSLSDENVHDDDDIRNNDTINIDIVVNNIHAVKVNNIDNLNPNFSTECCICLELIDPIDSFKLSNCDFHIFHEDCINSYLENNFTRCPVCNI